MSRGVAMKINIMTIPEEGLSIRFSLTSDAFADLVADQGQFAFTLPAVDVVGKVKKLRQNIFFAGTLETVVETPCSRCLETALVPIKAGFKNTMLPEVAAGKGDSELQAEDMDVTYYAGEIIDLAPLIVEQVILQIPIKVVCQESCRGLCPRCGANLNSGDCGCAIESIDPRLAGLKKFKLY